MDDFEKKLEMLKLITSSEHHFNNLTFNIRALASTWLLATFAGVGWILKDLPEKGTLLSIEKPDFIAALCLCSALGIFVLWVMDLKVYQQLLYVWFNGRELYEVDDQFPKIREKMKALFSSGRATEYIKFYYMVTCSAPLVLSIYLIKSFDGNDILIKVLIITLLFINTIIYFLSPSDKQKKKDNQKPK